MITAIIMLTPNTAGSTYLGCKAAIDAIKERVSTTNGFTYLSDDNIWVKNKKVHAY